jgi:hypothetical protein
MELKSPKKIDLAGSLRSGRHLAQNAGKPGELGRRAWQL